MAFSVFRERCFLALGVCVCCLGGMVFRPGNFDVSYDLFNVQKVANQNLFDIVVCGNSRSHENIDYRIISSYLPNIRIFNFGFGGNSGLSKEIMEAAAKRLHPNGKRIFLWMIDPHNIVCRINDFYHQYSSSVPFYKFLGERNWCCVRLFSRKVSLNSILFNTHPIQIQEEGSWYTYKSDQVCRGSKTSFQAINFSMLEEDLQFCKEHDIRCIVVAAASNKEVEECEEEFFKKKHVKEFFLKHGATWIDREPLHLETWDDLHLNVASGQRFAHWIGEKLRQIDWLREQ